MENKETCQPTENWCYTTNDLFKMNFNWTIHFFKFKNSCDLKNLSQITSPQLADENIPNLNWAMRIVTAWETDPLGGPNICFTFFALSSSTGRTQLTQASPLRVKFAVQNNQRKRVILKESNHVMKPKYAIDLEVFKIKTSEIASTFPFSKEGHLTILCEIQTLSDSVSSAVKKVRELPLDHFMQRCCCADESRPYLKDLFETMKFSDVTFKIQDSSLRAHKIILATRSPVFARMFDQEMAENVLNQVVISDIVPEVFQQILRFLYIGEVPATEMEKHAPELLAAADKYFLQTLKTECEKNLKHRVSIDNCLELFVIADMYSANFLKKEAFQFFRRNSTEVLKSEGWTTMKNNQPVIICEMLKIAFTTEPE